MYNRNKEEYYSCYFSKYSPRRIYKRFVFKRGRPNVDVRNLTIYMRLVLKMVLLSQDQCLDRNGSRFKSSPKAMTLCAIEGDR